MTQQEFYNQADRGSSTPEAAREYLTSRGLDPDAIIKEGMERLR